MTLDLDLDFRLTIKLAIFCEADEKMYARKLSETETFQDFFLGRRNSSQLLSVGESLNIASVTRTRLLVAGNPTQFIITDETDDCDIARSLPGQKKQRPRRKHSLSFNVANNTAPPLT